MADLANVYSTYMVQVVWAQLPAPIYVHTLTILTFHAKNVLIALGLFVFGNVVLPIWMFCLSYMVAQYMVV